MVSLIITKQKVVVTWGLFCWAILMEQLCQIFTIPNSSIIKNLRLTQKLGKWNNESSYTYQQASKIQLVADFVPSITLHTSPYTILYSFEANPRQCIISTINISMSTFKRQELLLKRYSKTTSLTQPRYITGVKAAIPQALSVLLPSSLFQNKLQTSPSHCMWLLCFLSPF